MRNMTRAAAMTVLLLALGVGTSVGAQARSGEQGLDLVRMLDPEVDTETRRALFAAADAALATDPDPARLYALGSMHRRGDSARDPAFPKNLDKAREYLSRAALAGVLPAMAKMSVLELDAGNRFEANVWAQLYYFYRKDAPVAPDRGSDGFAASLIANAKRGFDDSQVAALNDSVGQMVAIHDAKIRAGIAKRAADEQGSGLQPTRSGPRTLPDLPLKRPAAGVAEYYVQFDAQGEVARLWLLDAWPDAALARVLRPIAMAYRVKGTAGVDPNGQIALLPLEYNDLRFQIRKAD